MSLEPGEVVSRLSKCLFHKFDGPYVIVVNKCGESIDVDALEIKYWVTVRVEDETALGGRSARKEITERISLRKRIPPGGSIEVYFGPVENIDSVVAIVEYGGGRYRVELRRLVEEQGGGEEERGQQG